MRWEGERVRWEGERVRWEGERVRWEGGESEVGGGESEVGRGKVGWGERDGRGERWMGGLMTGGEGWEVKDGR